MILGIDPGYANTGWAVVRPKLGRVLACGLIITEKDKRKSTERSTDRARRMVTVARTIAQMARDHSCTTIAAEQALGHGAAAAVAANLLPWGALVGIAVMLGVELVEVPAKQWQHAVMPECTGKIDYDRLAQLLHRFTRGQAAAGLLEVPKRLRTHVVDAVGVGLFASLRETTRICERVSA